MCFLQSNSVLLTFGDIGSRSILRHKVFAMYLTAPSDACRSQICVANRVGPSTGNSMQEVMALVSESSTQSSKVGQVGVEV